MGAGDVYLGDIGGCPFYIGRSQYEYWKHTQLIIDVIDGHGDWSGIYLTQNTMGPLP